MWLGTSYCILLNPFSSSVKDGPKKSLVELKCIYMPGTKKGTFHQIFYFVAFIKYFILYYQIHSLFTRIKGHLLTNEIPRWYAIWQILIEHLPCAQHCSRHLGHISEQNRPGWCAVPDNQHKALMWVPPNTIFRQN